MQRKLIIPLLAAGALGCSCTRRVYVPVERVEVRTDSVRDVRLSTDSVAIRDSVFLYVKGDTVVRESWHTRTRLQLRTDTVYRQQRDTVVREVPVPVATMGGTQKRSKVSAALNSLGTGVATLGLIALALFVTLKTVKKK